MEFLPSEWFLIVSIWLDVFLADTLKAVRARCIALFSGLARA
jgi:hypothetical protein